MLLPAEAAHWHIREGGKEEKGRKERRRGGEEEGGEGEREQKGRGGERWLSS